MITAIVIKWLMTGLGLLVSQGATSLGAISEIFQPPDGIVLLERLARRCRQSVCPLTVVEPTHLDGSAHHIQLELGKSSMAKHAFTGPETAAVGRQISWSRNAMASTFISLVEHHVATFAFVGMEALVSYIQFKLKQPTMLYFK